MVEPKKKKRRLGKILLIVAVNLVVVVLLVLAAEVALSFIVSRPVDTIRGHARLNHIIKPHSQEFHQEWIAANPDFPEPYVHVRNAQGWLETYDVEKTKAPNIFRIFYVGDSFTEGTCAMELSVPSTVESKLNELAGDGMKVEVINTGTSSYSPTIHYVLIRYYLMEYDPDLIVINVDMTDDFDDWKYAELLTVDDDGNPLAVEATGYFGHHYTEGPAGVVPATAMERTTLFLSRYSYVYNFIDRVKGRLGLGGAMVTAADPHQAPPANTDALYQRWSWCQPEWDDHTAANVDRTLDLLRRIATLCEKQDVKLMLTAVPHYWQFAGSDDGEGPPRWSSRPHEVIGGVAQEMNVPYLNSYEAMKPVIEGTSQPEYYYTGDMHFNPRGYGAWAERHIAFLTDPANGLLPESLLASSGGVE